MDLRILGLKILKILRFSNPQILKFWVYAEHFDLISWRER